MIWLLASLVRLTVLEGSLMASCFMLHGLIRSNWDTLLLALFMLRTGCTCSPPQSPPYSLPTTMHVYIIGSPCILSSSSSTKDYLVLVHPILVLPCKRFCMAWQCMVVPGNTLPLYVTTLHCNGVSSSLGSNPCCDFGKLPILITRHVCACVSCSC